MIHAIVATDNQRGIANESGIPWNLPTDTKFYKDKIKDKTVAMGRTTYETHDTPFSNQPNYVLTSGEVREGFVAAPSALVIVKVPEDVWVIGGAQVFEQLYEHIGKIYLTRVDADFNCTKFFPDFKDDFECLDPGVKQTENGLDFYQEIWRRKNA